MDLRRPQAALDPSALAGKPIRKIESVSAYVACADVDHRPERQLMTCDDCGAARGIRDGVIVESLRQLGEGRGFAVVSHVIEARGLRPPCRATHCRSRIGGPRTGGWITAPGSA